MAGLKDVWVASLRADMAMMVMTGNPSILLAPSLDGYKGRLIIHVASYIDREDEAEAYKRILQNNWSPEDFPTASIVGWGKIIDNKEYTTSTFAADIMLHGYSSHDLNVFKTQEGWTDEAVFGLHIAGLQLLKLPIMGVGEEYQHGEWWQPQTPFEVLSIKRGLEGESVDVDAILT